MDKELNMGDIIIQSGEDEPIRDYSRGYLTIPFEGDNFKNFISSLLGRPQRISKFLEGPFLIDFSNIKNFHDLINQRITQQNSGTLIQFSAKIYFSDKSSIQLNGLQDFLTYNELKPVISEGLKITWIYLIQFPDKDYPEKQTIEIFFNSKTRKIKDTLQDDIVHTSKKGYVIIDIDHTARTWGSDMENVIVNHIESILLKENKVSRTAYQYKSGLGLVAGFCVFMIAYMQASKLKWQILQNELNKFEKYSSSQKFTFDEKLRTLLKYIISNDSLTEAADLTMFYILFVTIALAVFIFVDIQLASLEPSSHIVLTRKSNENHINESKRIPMRWLRLIGVIIINIALALFASYIYDFFYK